MSNFFNRVFPFDKKKPADTGSAFPSLDLPSGSRCPYPLSPYFTGREQELTDLARMVVDTYHGPVILCGPLGAGKTQLALAFCSRYGNRFQGVHWIQSGPSSSIEMEIVECGRAMQIDPWPENQADPVTATIRAWNETPDRLLVISGLENLPDLNSWLMKWEKLRILVVSEETQAACQAAGLPGVHCLPVEGFKPEDSQALLRKICPRLENTPSESLDRLSGSLGNLPLAVTLASRYLKENPKISPDSLLGEVEKSVLADPQQIPAWAQGFPAAQAAYLAAAYKIFLHPFFSKGDRENSASLILLSASYCAPRTAIPGDLLSRALDEKPAKSTDLDRGLRRLMDAGVLEWIGRDPAIHPLIAEIIRDEASTQGTAVLEHLADAFEGQKTGQPEIALQLLPHLIAVAFHADQLGLKQAGMLWQQSGNALWALKHTARARTYIERGLAADEKIFGADHPNIAAGFYQLGRIQSETGDRKSARESFLRAIAVTGRAFSPQHPDIAVYSSELGKLMMEAGDLQGAKSCFERSLAIHEAAFGYGPKHPDTAMDWNNLGNVLRSMGDTNGAKDCFEKALAIDEWVYWMDGMQHPNVAVTYNNLGKVLHAAGKQPEAKNYLERALAIQRKTLGKEHPTVAATLNNLGLVLHDTGSLTEARSCFEQALAIDEKVYGPEHTIVARDVNNLGSILRDQNDLFGAKKSFERALSINENVSGPLHADVAINANNLGRVLYSLGELSKAKNCFERVLAIDEKVYGRERPEVASDVTNIGVILQDQGDLLTAKRYFERALNILEKAFPADHPKVLRARKSLERVKKQIEERPSTH